MARSIDSDLTYENVKFSDDRFSNLALKGKQRIECGAIGVTCIKKLVK